MSDRSGPATAGQFIQQEKMRSAEVSPPRDTTLAQDIGTEAQEVSSVYEDLLRRILALSDRLGIGEPDSNETKPGSLCAIRLGGVLAEVSEQQRRQKDICRRSHQMMALIEDII